MRTATSLTQLLAALAVASATLAAQGLPMPEGWQWVADAPVARSGVQNPPDGTFRFGTMAPGWHITSRPAVTLFDPAVEAAGRFVLESEMILFPSTSQAGYGVMVGGKNLQAADARYVAFQIRGDGSAAVEKREAGTSSLLHPWTPNAAIKPHPGKGTVGNILRIEAEADTVTLLVNGTKVLEVPRTPGAFDGIVGLRIGENIDIHVTNLDVTRRLALPRRPQG